MGIQHGDLDSAREDFVRLLSDYGKRSGHEITVVFDGHKAGPGAERIIVRAGVRIIYSGLGERADNVILRLISLDKAGWIVVSSDRAIAKGAWGAGCVPIGSQAFVEKVYERLRASARVETASTGADAWAPDQKDAKDHNAAGHEAQRGGNPLQRSRKDKAIHRALGRL